MSGNSDLTDLMLHLHAETKLAILVSDDGAEKSAVWLPKSQVEVSPAPGTGGSKNVVLVTLPEWLAIERGLV